MTLLRIQRVLPYFFPTIFDTKTTKASDISMVDTNFIFGERGRWTLHCGVIWNSRTLSNYNKGLKQKWLIISGLVGIILSYKELGSAGHWDSWVNFGISPEMQGRGEEEPLIRYLSEVAWKKKHYSPDEASNTIENHDCEAQWRLTLCTIVLHSGLIHLAEVAPHNKNHITSLLKVPKFSNNH